MNKKIRNCLVFMIIILCFLTISSPVFAEAGMSEITYEEWKELEEELWSSGMGIILILLSPIILLLGMVLLIVKLCADFFSSACIILNSFDVVHIVDIIKLFI